MIHWKDEMHSSKSVGRPLLLSPSSSPSDVQLSPLSKLDELPIQVLNNIFNYCDTPSLGALSLTCRRLNQILKDDYIWKLRGTRVLVANQLSDFIKTKSLKTYKWKEKCKLELNWKKKRYRESCLLSSKTPLIPWIELDKDSLWCTKENFLLKYTRNKTGRITGNKPAKALAYGEDDILRFSIRDGLVASCGLEGSLSLWSKSSGNLLAGLPRAHRAPINGVEIFDKDVLLSGSRDKTVAIWRAPASSNRLTSVQSINVEDRVWCVTRNEEKTYAVVGSAGFGGIKPLRIIDVHRGQIVGSLGTEYRNGAGVLHAISESNSTLISCGYDTCIRTWDMRASWNQSVLTWEDPHDSAVYCLASDHNVTVLSGTSRYGLVRLWDKRLPRKCVQMYYNGTHNSPVYSLDFDPAHLYVALDHSLNLLTFDGSGLKKHS